MGGRRWTPAEDTALLATNFTPNTLRYTGESGIADTAERLGAPFTLVATASASYWGAWTIREGQSGRIHRLNRGMKHH